MASTTTTISSSDTIILTDGTQDFSGGVDSSKVTTIESTVNPNGLDRSELAWLINAGVRDGGITPRGGLAYRGTVHAGGDLYQGGLPYQPLGADPYLVVLIGGVPYKIDLTTYGITDLSFGDPTLRHRADIEQAFFEQAEQFLIIQCGDYYNPGPPNPPLTDPRDNNRTLPLFWDNLILRRSIGKPAAVPAPGTSGVSEIPSATSMSYYMQRLFYARARTVNAGDIVGGNSGTDVWPTFYNFKDAVLNVTESPLVVGGDGFTIPTFAGNIRGLKYAAAIDATLGQGTLYIFTREQIYSLSVPVTRSDWISADSNNQPLMKVVQHVNGSVNDRGIVSVNGDLFFQALEPSIRSLLLAVRYFQQWGNTSISANIDRILQFNDRALLHGASGMVFNNRLWMTALPHMTDCGVAHQALVPIDFDPISSFKHDRSPIYEGHTEGLDHLQIFNLDFNGLARAFSIARSQLDGSIQIWEFTEERFDSSQSEPAKRITMVAETPAYTFSLPFKLKKLEGGEIWVDRVYGDVTVKVWYRVDADPCWRFWHVHEFCVSRNTSENVYNPSAYPSDCGEGYRWAIVLPNPPHPNDSMNVRPANIGYQFQLKIEVIGFARIRTVLVYAAEQPRGIYHGLTKQNTPPNRQALPILPP